MPLAAVATLVGATLQSATGFGFALLLGPVLFGVLEPARALTTLLLLGAALNLLVLFGERRTRHIRSGEILGDPDHDDEHQRAAADPLAPVPS